LFVGAYKSAALVVDVVDGIAVVVVAEIPGGGAAAALVDVVDGIADVVAEIPGGAADLVVDDVDGVVVAVAVAGIPGGGGGRARSRAAISKPGGGGGGGAGRTELNGGDRSPSDCDGVLLAVTVTGERLRCVLVVDAFSSRLFSPLPGSGTFV
jgi:hypothetical protein